MTFELLQQRLIARVRERVRNGMLTESRLARLMGMSQPHIHNVLKGARLLSTELADQILRQLQINIRDLIEISEINLIPFRNVSLLSGALGLGMREFRAQRISGSIAIPASIAELAEEPLAVRLADDSEMLPRFHAGDLVLIDQSRSARLLFERDAAYLVNTAIGPRIRYVRPGEGRLYLPSETRLPWPSRWEEVALGKVGELEVIRAKVVWISREPAKGSWSRGNNTTAFSSGPLNPDYSAAETERLI